MPYQANLVTFGFCPLPNTLVPMALNRAEFYKSGQSLQWFVQIPETVLIRYVGINISQLHGAPVEFQLSLRAVNNDGTAGAILTGVGGPAKVDFVPSAVGFQFFELEHLYYAAWGQFICVQLEPNVAGATYDGIDVLGSVSGYSNPGMNTPYVRGTNLDGFQFLNTLPIVALASRTELRYYGNPLLDVEPLTLPSEASRPATRFRLPGAFGGTFQVAGVRVRFGWPGFAGTYMSLWKDGVATPLQTTANFAFQWVGSTAPNAAHGDMYFTGTLANLQYGEEYFIGFDSDDASIMNAVSVADNKHLDAYPGGREVHAAYLSNTGAWVRVPTKRLFMDLILQQY